MLRPDYASAKSTLLELALKHLSSQGGVVLADFCCGTGLNTKMLAGRLPIEKAILIDHNKEFIDLAKQSDINASIEPVVGDILQVPLVRCADAVVSMFAYHHVRDDQKMDYLKKVKEVLKKDGLLFLGEIYMPDKETTIEYYRKLYESIPEKSQELKDFLTQTAESDDYEYKVAKYFADGQLREAGFEKLESRKIWPLDDEFGKDVGTFVEVWRVVE
ncbi:MAG: hypothetical protein A3F51_01690 [Candidatus Taylorbacteria bacterium RIFCSPHIGHO2_12_FULL_45_16]|uniref:Methyltransferase domain-containing protein n=1 Tax=Candidatus Taylorbacteria bacterium RIFCSPHIGHO2_12_FULL_45_16 TaxID=1802315 RepID=A0A1G2N265_9BACT|nr:MAG: hypothetical protein A3F51_01690 [Candidatus Taylorbacteria bacterium RIFCSPHIGHO2_12_FULL_45_16]OHA33523.1 MAG: hypothetical protein A3A23_02570 [Candidatus Taylorbacteria bacterium RIFCSPLOWO2_01_FULL_45_59]OHA39147.1 MAG: hypothetical protein A3I98_00920 [Candidatus Taylorbacteria bacterium RIFCSPLOWO2_02_FULL_45_10b]